MDAIKYITDLIDESLKTHYYKDVAFYGLCSQEYKGKERMPMFYKGNGNFDYVGFNDNHGLNIYHRITSYNETDNLNEGFGLSMLREETHTIQMVCFGNQQKVNNGATLDINLRIADEMKGLLNISLTNDQLSTLGLQTCIIRNQNVNRNKNDVFKDEFPDTETSKIKPNSILFCIAAYILL